jgi:lysophospholipase L1-like esterase
VKRTSVAAVGITLLLSGAVLTLAATSQARPTAPQQYYLALGDSIAYGVQPAKVVAGLPPSGFHTGYVDVFAARLRALAPKIRVVNYGCPGESTTTFIAGGCPWLAEKRRLHDAFRGAQLGAALSFLRAHSGQVSPITLTLGGNDLGELADACKGSFACIQGRSQRAFAQFASRMTTIVSRLRGAAPKAEIIVTGIWNFNADALGQTDPLFRSFEATIARVTSGTKVRFADTLPVFNPQGNLAREKARLCSLTFACAGDGDPHPTDAGYRAIAAAIFAASGYANRS